ncbi:MAG: PAS domain S-box protein [Chloroflexaceae bacterium]
MRNRFMPSLLLLHRTTVFEHAILQDWRVRVLNGILRGMFVLGLLAVISSIWSILSHLPAEQHWHAVPNALFYLSAYAVLGVITFVERIGFTLRASILLTFLYLLGVIDCLTFGLSGDGYILFFACTTLTAVLFDVRRSIGVLAIVMGTLALLALLLVTEQIVVVPTIQTNAAKPLAWLSSMLVFLLLIGAVIIPVTYLLRELSRSLGTTEEYAQRIAAAHNELEAQVAARTAALRESETRYRTISELGSDYIYTLHIAVDGTFVLDWISETFTRTLGYTLEEVRQLDDVRQIVHPDDRPVLSQRLTAIADGQVDTQEFRVITREGTVRWMRNRLRRETDPEQSVVRIMGAAQDITGRRQAEESVHFQAHLLNLVDQAVVAIDTDGTVIYWNHFAEDLLGWSAGEVLGTSGFDLGPTPATRAHAADIITQVLQGTGWSGELEIVRRDTATFPALLTCSPIYAAHGDVRGLVAIIVDITERKQMEETLRASEQKFRSFVEQSIDGIVLCDEQGNIVEWNQSMAQVGGIAAPDALGRPLWDVLHQMAPTERKTPEAYAFTRDAFQEFFGTGQAVWLGETQEHTVQHPDGTRRVVQTRGFPIHSEAGFMAGTILRDVTDYIQTQAALQANEELFRTLVESMSDIVCLLDREQRYVRIFGRQIEELGFSRDELRGKTLREVLGAEAAALHEAANARALAGEHITYEWTLPTAEEPLLLHISLSPITTADGAITGIVAVGRDITDRKRIEEALQESHQRIHNILESISDAFFALDYAYRFTYVNQQATHLLQYQPEELLGQCIWDMFTEAINTTFFTQYHRAMNEQTAVTFEEYYAPLAIWFEVHAYPSRDGLSVYFRDISARRQADAVLRASEQRFRTLFEESPDAIFVEDLDGTILDVNPAACRLHRVNCENLIGNQVFRGEPALPEHYPALIHDFPHQVTDDTTFAEGCCLTGDGQRIPVEIRIGRITYRDTPALLLHVRDITQRKQTEAALQHANTHLTHWVRELEQRTHEITLLNNMGDLLQACRTAEEAYAVIGQIAPQLFPGESGALYMLSASHTLLGAVALWGPLPVQRTSLPDECWSLRRGRIHLSQDTRVGLCCEHLPTPLPACSLCIPMMAQSETLGVFHLCREQASFSDATRQLAATVTEHIALALANLRLQETLRHQAIRDPLTGLFNRRYMEEALERELRRAARHTMHLGVIMLDLDHFKQFNDTFGHAAGDTVLRELGACLRAQMHGEDLAARYGGEEFTLIILDAVAEEIVQQAERILNSVRQLQVQYRGQALGAVTVSLGAAIFPTHGTTVEELVRAADAALYRAKTAGRNCIVVSAADSAMIEWDDITTVTR